MKYSLIILLAYNLTKLYIIDFFHLRLYFFSNITDFPISILSTFQTVFNHTFACKCLPLAHLHQQHFNVTRKKIYIKGFNQYIIKNINY